MLGHWGCCPERQGLRPAKKKTLCCRYSRRKVGYRCEGVSSGHLSMLTDAGGQCVEYTNSGDLCNLDYDTHLDNGRN